MKIRSLLLPAMFAVCSALALPALAETVRIGNIDPYSGPAAALSMNSARSIKYMADMANRERWAGAHSFEVVEFDNKGSTQDSLVQLKNALDQGIRYIVQGHSSAVGMALTEAIEKYNERNPGKEAVFLNSTNTAPEMTNEKCSYWHFAFDSNMNLKVEGLASSLARVAAIKKVYSINQNYAMGQATSALTRSLLKLKRPDIEIVGDDLHPMLAVKDFSTYVAKIRASGADAVVTSSWSADLTLLLKAAKDASLKTPFYTVNAATTGIPTALAAAAIDNVKVVFYWNPNDDLAMAKAIADPFKARYDDDFVRAPHYNMIKILATAIKEANSTAPAAVVRKMEGMKIKGLNGDVEMRASDHQILQPLFIANWTKVDGKDLRYDLEKTGWGWKTEEKVEAGTLAAAHPTTCRMKRPA